MEPYFAPRSGWTRLHPMQYQELYTQGVPPSDYLKRGGRAVFPFPPEATEADILRRVTAFSPEQPPQRGLGVNQGGPFRPLKELPRNWTPPPATRPEGFPLKLLEGGPTKPGILPTTTPAPGLMQLAALLLSLQGDTDPNIAQWREERAMVTPPERARSVPDRLLAMPPVRRDPEAERIQELADAIYRRRGRD